MNVLLVGASVRAASASLLRAGRRPVAFDLYDDLDLASTCESTRIPREDYPDGIWGRVRHLPAMPWIYTGAIENHPEVVEAISTRFRPLGNGRDILRRVRDPFEVAKVVGKSGLLAPEVRPTALDLPTDRSWLVKPFASGGGEGIEPWLGVESTRPGRVYYQRMIPGPSLSATFVRDPTTTRFVGAARQYLGRPGNRFGYRGSLAPWPLPDATRGEVERLGRTVGEAFGLLGLFGIDLVVAGGRPWLIEVNPRYTASVEILEYALGRSIMAEHLRAFGETAPPEAERTWPFMPVQFAAKAILFARSQGSLDEPIPLERADDGMPLLADIPRPGTAFEAGQPVMTVFGRGDTLDACRLDLARRIRSWKRRIEVARPGAIRPGC